MISFTETNSFRNAFLTADETQRLYLIDLELGGKETGIDLIKDLKIQSSSILVTTIFDNRKVQEEVMRNNFGIIPKYLLTKVNIIQGNQDYYDVVFIDDDKIIRLSWEIQAQKKKVKLLSLGKGEELIQYMNLISMDHTKIYIDSNLGTGGIGGEELAQSLYQKGYKNLYLATGYDKSDFSHYPWLKIRGKDCPF